MIEGLQGWPAVVAMIVAGTLFGFRIYLQSKKALREETGLESVSDEYRELIKSLAEENRRLVKKQVECDACHEELHHLRELLSHVREELALAQALVRKDLDPNNRRLK